MLDRINILANKGEPSTKNLYMNLFEKKIKNIKRLQAIRKLVDTNPRPSFHDLDRQIEKYINYDNGFFIEAGANNGYTQSNTFYYEYKRNWKGILIEPFPKNYEMCKYIRINSKVYNCALVSSAYDKPSVKMRYAGLMTIVDGALKSKENDDFQVQKAMKYENIKESFEFEAEARTLTSILDESDINTIDFLSLDVEGYEAQVLNGLDFNKYRPKFILVEARFKDEIEKIILPYYKLIDVFTKGWDHLYALKWHVSLP